MQLILKTVRVASIAKPTTPLIAATLSLAVAWLLYGYVRGDIEREARLQFERQAADARHVIERRLRSYVDVTYGLKALFSSRDFVSRAEFNRYVTSLKLEENYPGFVQLNYAHHVKDADKADFEKAVRADRSLEPAGYPRFAIKPPGRRPEYHVLVYIEPMEGNEFAFGLDIGTVGASGKNMDLLRDAQDVISSGRLLNIGKEKAVGLAMRLPVHRHGMPTRTAEERRAAFVGSVGAGYNVRKLMAGVLDQTTMVGMRYRLYDAGAVGGPRRDKPSLLFDSAQRTSGAPQDGFVVPGAAPTFDTVLPLELAGRNWELHFSAPVAGFISPPDAWLPRMVFIAGLVMSALLFAVLYAFASSRERAEAMAGKITRELRESEANLAHAEALARLGSWTLDTRTGEMTWSAETYRLLGLAGGPAPRLETFLAWFGEGERAQFREALEGCVRSGAPCSLELPLRPGGGEARWAHLVLQPEGTLVRGTIMDVTERKRALEAQRASAAQIRDLLRRLVSVQEAERRRFSANLHDLVGQSLSVIGIGLETIRGMLPGNVPARAQAAINDMEQVVRETMGAVRTVMSDLRPPLLDDYGLPAALTWYAQQLAGRTGLCVAVEADGLEPRPAAEVEMALFRIVQEALTNVAKHAAASHARVSLSRAAGRLTLVVEDDGRGIGAAANDPAGASWGMAVMRERAGAVGGDMRVESLGKGTRIVVEVAA